MEHYKYLGDWQIFPLLLLLAGSFLIAKGMRVTDSGKIGLRWAALLTLPIAILLRYAMSNEAGISAVILTLRDLSFALLATYFWERLHKRKVTFFIATGILVMGLSIGAYIFSFAVDTLKTFLREKDNDMQVENTQYILELGPDDTIKEVEHHIEKAGASYKEIFSSVAFEEDEDLAQYFLISCPKANAANLEKVLLGDKENVDSYELNHIMREVPILTAKPLTKSPSSGVNDPLAPDQWALASINLSYEKLRTLRPIRKARVAIIDTGVDKDHEDLEDAFLPSPGSFDENGHGTHCAGIAGAITNNQRGIASLNWEGQFIEIMSFRALNSRGSGSVESVASAIIEAVQAGADVISLSLGGWHPTPPKAQVDAIKYAIRNGCLVVAAAGNSSESAKEFAPANIPGVIVVTALNEKNELASFSNTVEGIPYAVAAPGVSILSLKPGNAYVALSGTSMATPLVAGILGVIKAINPNIKQKQAYELLNATGEEGQTSASQMGKIIKVDKLIEQLSKTI
jgi:thermitase